MWLKRNELNEWGWKFRHLQDFCASCVVLLCVLKSRIFVLLSCVKTIWILKLLCSSQTQFLIQECASLITKPNFISTLSYAIDNPLHYQKVCMFVHRILLGFFMAGIGCGKVFKSWTCMLCFVELVIQRITSKKQIKALSNVCYLMACLWQAVPK